MKRNSGYKLTPDEQYAIKDMLRKGEGTKAIVAAVPNANPWIVSYYRREYRNGSGNQAQAEYEIRIEQYLRPLCREGDCQASPIGKTHYCEAHTPLPKSVKPYSDFISPIPLNRLMARR